MASPAIITQAKEVYQQLQGLHSIPLIARLKQQELRDRLQPAYDLAFNGHVHERDQDFGDWVAGISSIFEMMWSQFPQTRIPMGKPIGLENARVVARSVGEAQRRIYRALNEAHAIEKSVMRSYTSRKAENITTTNHDAVVVNQLARRTLDLARKLSHAQAGSTPYSDLRTAIHEIDEINSGLRVLPAQPRDQIEGLLMAARGAMEDDAYDSRGYMRPGSITDVVVPRHAASDLNMASMKLGKISVDMAKAAPPSKKAATTPKSDAYRAGYQDALEAASDYGHTRLSPSITQRQDWKGDWQNYMRGWKAGMQKVGRE